MYESTVLDTRQCKVAKRNCAFAGERLEGVYQSLGWVCPFRLCCCLAPLVVDVLL